MNIVICDDDASGRESWQHRLKSLLGVGHEIQMLDFDTFMASYGELAGRRKSARERRAESDRRLTLAELPEEDEWTETPFDSADVLLVDYDLFSFKPDDYLTGPIVAYMVRCYSKCRTIVGVNEIGKNPFDLTLLGRPNSFADVVIGEAQLDNPGLWLGRPDGFRPWIWPTLADLVERQSRRAEHVVKRLDEPLLDVVGLTDVEERLPRSAIGLLEIGAPTGRTTVDDLARGPRVGYGRGDEACSRQSVARVAAARGAKWVEGVVLPLQDVLIDAPHLAQRNPLLLEAEDTASADWEVTTQIGVTHEECGLRSEVLPYRHTAPDWLTRPAFYWPGVSTAGDLPGVSDPYRIPVVDKVFCEDLSSFLPRAQARRFVSKLDSSTPVRWLADPEASGHPELLEINYQPVARLAM